MSHHNGVAEQQNKDRTGAPGSQQVCTACHSGGTYSVTPSIAVYANPGLGTPVQTFMPNTEYYVEFTVGATGAPDGYGFQATAVFANGSNAGTFIDCTSNAQLEDVGGRHIVEQNDLSPSNTFPASTQTLPMVERVRSPFMPACWRVTVLTATAAILRRHEPHPRRGRHRHRMPRLPRSRSASRFWATEYAVFVENATDLTLEAFAVDDGGCVPSICPRAGTS